MLTRTTGKSGCLGMVFNSYTKRWQSSQFACLFKEVGTLARLLLSMLVAK